MISALALQTYPLDRILVIDSSSSDGTVVRFQEVGAEVVTIPRHTFDHGGTRNEGVRRLGTDIVVFLTQDAVPANGDAVGNLVAALRSDPRRAVVFGRQLPAPGARPLACAHRDFNYGPEPFERSKDDVAQLGVRAAFNSNSFAAYRSEALWAVGGFPSPIVGSEDRWAAARFLQGGRTVAYAPSAVVVHSHDYTYRQDFRRYFDIGVFHASERWFDVYLGAPQSEGLRLVRAQWHALRSRGTRFALPLVASHAAVAWLGYHVGRHHSRLSPGLAARWSTAPAYFAGLTNAERRVWRRGAER
jgi:rhamnosyltransferase